VIDEAFGHGSDASTRYALELFAKLGLQLKRRHILDRRGDPGRRRTRVGCAGDRPADDEQGRADGQCLRSSAMEGQSNADQAATMR